MAYQNIFDLEDILNFGPEINENLDCWDKNDTQYTGNGKQEEKVSWNRLMNVAYEENET